MSDPGSTPTVDPPASLLTRYKSNKRVYAGEIIRAHADGCDVRNADGSAAFRHFHSGMQAHGVPQRGDYWTIYEDGFVMIWPAVLFFAESGGFELIDVKRDPDEA